MNQFIIEQSSDQQHVKLRTPDSELGTYSTRQYLF